MIDSGMRRFLGSARAMRSNKEVGVKVLSPEVGFLQGLYRDYTGVCWGLYRVTWDSVGIM